jgi:hypothetical protein
VLKRIPMGFRLGAGIAVFWLLILAIPYSGVKSQQPPQDQAENSQSQAARPHAESGHSAVEIPNAPAADGRTGHDTEKGNEEKPDWTARWTGLLVLVTAGLIVIGYCTIRAMRETERRSLRAYVGMDEIVEEFTNLTTPNYVPNRIVAGAASPDRLLVRLKNFGSTPSNRTSVWVNWQPTPFPQRLPENFTYPDYDGVTGGDVRPVWSRATVFPDQIHISFVQVNDLTAFRDAVARRVSLYLYGHIDYADVYGRPHTTTFCFTYDVTRTGRDRFIPYEEHNEAR